MQHNEEQKRCALDLQLMLYLCIYHPHAATKNDWKCILVKHICLLINLLNKLHFLTCFIAIFQYTKYIQNASQLMINKLFPPSLDQV